MQGEFSRTELLIGKEVIEKLSKKKVAIFGIGGVGSYVAEGLCRTGIGRFLLVDDDLICLTNINRQLHALHSTIGRPKVEVMKERILDINPHAEVEVKRLFFLPETADDILPGDIDYIVDAVDTVTAKIELALQAKKRNIPIISCMGAGNKLDPTKLEVADIFDTSVCPLCKVMRNELKKRDISSLKVVFSREMPIKVGTKGLKACEEGCVCPKGAERKCTSRRAVPGSIAFVPSVAGLIIAAEVTKDLIAL